MDSYEKLEKQWNDMKEKQNSDLEILLERERKAIKWLTKKIERYEEALRFYADKDGTWEDGEYEGGLWFSVAERDSGETARKALESKTI